MITEAAINCDVCLTPKQSTNHWWCVRSEGGRIIIEDWDNATRLKTVRKPGTRHVCGQGCVSTLMSKLLSQSHSEETKKKAASLGDGPTMTEELENNQPVGDRIEESGENGKS